MPVRTFLPGEVVVYCKSKMSTHPGLRAEHIHPSAGGEEYAYVVDKYWVVTREIDEEFVEVKTRTGKLHQLRKDDALLRKATWFEKLLKSKRFPKL